MGWRKIEKKKSSKRNTDKTRQIESTKLVAELNPNTWIIIIIVLNSSVFRIAKEIKDNAILLTRDVSKMKSHRNETGKDWRKIIPGKSTQETAIVADTQAWR